MTPLGIAGRVAAAFIDSKLTPLMVAASVLLGAGAILLLPREEEPQIIVPMVDIFVEMPGASSREVEERVTKPMEKLLWEIPGVEYIYSTSSPGLAMAVVRFYVGEDEEDAIVRLNQKMFANLDLIPPGASPPLIKPRSINDVPILALTLWSRSYDHYMLRRLAAQLHDEVKAVPDVSEVTISGGQKRQLRVILDGSRLAAYHLSPTALATRLKAANHLLPAGEFTRNNQEFLIDAGDFLRDAADVEQVVVAVYDSRPVYLSEVATVEDGPAEADDYVLFGAGPAFFSGHHVGRLSESGPFPISGSGSAAEDSSAELEGINGNLPAVTLSVAKRAGTNATVVADAILNKIERLEKSLIPSEVHITVTRNYGATAEEKSNELLFHMLLAILSVSALIWLVLGLRESGVVAVAIPVTLALTLVVFYFYGYTLNRVTLFALIFSIGILVDDAIVVVENIVRHYRLPDNRSRSITEVALEAVDEVGNPTILATFAVIAAILPMAFVRGLMGPYMRPIPVGASTAMLFSLMVAFVVTPWASLRLLQRKPAAASNSHSSGAESEDWTTRLYRRLMKPLIREKFLGLIFLCAISLLLLAAVSLFAFKLVMVKMLPFDNKSEFQVILDLPEGTSLEKSTAAAREIGLYLATIPEVTDYQIYAGTASPYNFNGLVRHYFLRKEPFQADIQVNLIPRHQRSRQSHDIATAVRPPVAEIGKRYGASVKIAEVPPGPPVLQTLVAEVYGPDYGRQMELAARIEEMFRRTEGVVDVDSYLEADQVKYRFAVDRSKAALNGISTAEVAENLRLALDGLSVGLLHRPEEKEDVSIFLRLSRAQRSSLEDLLELKLQGAGRQLVPLSELVRIEEVVQDKSIYHKNLMPVVYVTGDVALPEESPVYAVARLGNSLEKLDIPEGYQVEQYTASQPFLADRLSVKWDGEWYITYEVFRDLGIAFAVVLVLIYILVVGWFQSLTTPLVIMAAIPFSLVGIIPAHWLMGAFFTATSMIGFIAGAGIVVRNSIILVDFIELRLKQGMPLAEAVVDAGAVRFRPMMLTAAAVVAGASVILFDPIFQGLALALMAGEVASLLLSRMAVPVLYFLLRRKQHV